MHEVHYLGVDAGGSRTICLLGDADRVLGRGEAGPANPRVRGVDGFRAALTEAVRAASRDLHRVQSPTAAWIGVAGSAGAGMHEALQGAARDVLATDRVEVSHDGRLLLAAAGVRSGIAVVSGTGSSVYGLGADGREAIVGGWGHLLGDEGSGHDIGRKALRAATQAADGRGPATRLLDALLAEARVATAIELRDRWYPAPPVDAVAALARIVLELAADDAVAAGIVRTAAGDLATAVATCRDRLGDAGPVDVVAAGGLLRDGSPLLERLAAELHALDPGYRVQVLRDEPVTGALALARAGPGGSAQDADGGSSGTDSREGSGSSREENAR